MDISAQKEQFSKAYVKTLAAQAGINHEENEVDDDSVDITFKGKGFTGGKYRNPTIDVQLKCTSTNVLNGDKINFPLKLKNYNDLRGENVTSPRYLMLLIVPEKPDDWAIHNESSLTLYNSCYWVSLRFEPETSNQTSVTIEIPVNQKVTKDSLLFLLEMASKGEFI